MTKKEPKWRAIRKFPEYIDIEHCSDNVHECTYYNIALKKWMESDKSDLEDFDVDYPFCPICKELAPEYIVFQAKLLIP